MVLLERKLLKKYILIALCWIVVLYWPIWCFCEHIIWGVVAIGVHLPLFLYFFHITNWTIPIRHNYFKLIKEFTREQRQYISGQCLDCTCGKPKIGSAVFLDDLILFVDNGRAVFYQDVRNITVTLKRVGGIGQKAYCHEVTFCTQGKKIFIRVYNQKWLFEGEDCAFAKAMLVFNAKHT